MASTAKMRFSLLLAVSAGLALRLLFILRFPFYEAGDTKVYEDLARNWAAHGVYGYQIAGRLTSVDIRLPGYPAFLAAVHALCGPSARAVMIAQAAVDLAACWAVALLAAHLAPAEARDRVRLAGFWLAALCPFLANYTAVELAEVLATFFTALSLVALCLVVRSPTGVSALAIGPVFMDTAFLGGLLAGLGTLVRPETPLVLAAAGLALVWRWRRRPPDWRRLARQGLWLGLGLLLPLLPWAARNWRTLHEVQFLAPRYATLPGEFVPRGFYVWTRTWSWRSSDAERVIWKLEAEPLAMSDFPAAAFDSPEERNEVAALLEQYDQALNLTPAMDAEFARLARQRTRRRPLRTYLWVPLGRAAALWLTPRVELLPVSGWLWPVGKAWEEGPVDFLVTAVFALLNLFFLGLAIAGLRRAKWNAGIVFLLLFILVRTAFLTRIETTEPRYVLECFPALLALGALVWVPRSTRVSPSPRGG
jgi:hypothetical protein